MMYSTVSNLIWGWNLDLHVVRGLTRIIPIYRAEKAEDGYSEIVLVDPDKLHGLDFDELTYMDEDLECAAEAYDLKHLYCLPDASKWIPFSKLKWGEMSLVLKNLSIYYLSLTCGLHQIIDWNEFAGLHESNGDSERAEVGFIERNMKRLFIERTEAMELLDRYIPWRGEDLGGNTDDCSQPDDDQPHTAV